MSSISKRIISTMPVEELAEIIIECKSYEDVNAIAVFLNKHIRVVWEQGLKELHELSEELIEETTKAD